MVLKEHQYLDVSWETTSPTQGLEDNSLHPDLVLAIERWCTGLLVNVEPWLPRGDDFTSRVRRACAQIPWGETRTYGQLAQSAPPKPVAVGQAMRRNPLPLLIPCHRVVGLWSGDTPQIKMAPNLQENEQSWPSSKMSANPRWVPYRLMPYPPAQLDRAARLHRVGRWFESSSADSWSMHARHCRTSPSP